MTADSTNTMKTNKTRFSDRVEDYIKYRPKYPYQMIEVLEDKIGLDDKWVIADIGSGTGISSEPFINNGNKVSAVEPNKEMREAAELNFAGNSNFLSIDGSAEKSNLDGESIDLIFCGQAFHWFDKIKSKIEFKRILKQNGHIVLAWNVRNEKNSFQRGYEQVLKQNIAEYCEVTHKNITDKEVIDFFLPKTSHKESLENYQTLDLEGLKGRLKSSSYCPKTGIDYERLMKEIEDLFHKFEKNGLIKFDYEIKMYWC